MSYQNTYSHPFYQHYNTNTNTNTDTNYNMHSTALPRSLPPLTNSIQDFSRVVGDKSSREKGTSNGGSLGTLGSRGTLKSVSTSTSSSSSSISAPASDKISYTNSAFNPFLSSGNESVNGSGSGNERIQTPKIIEYPYANSYPFQQQQQQQRNNSSTRIPSSSVIDSTINTRYANSTYPYSYALDSIQYKPITESGTIQSRKPNMYAPHSHTYTSQPMQSSQSIGTKSIGNAYFDTTQVAKYHSYESTQPAQLSQFFQSGESSQSFQSGESVQSYSSVPMQTAISQSFPPFTKASSNTTANGRKLSRYTQQMPNAKRMPPKFNTKWPRREPKVSSNNNAKPIMRQLSASEDEYIDAFKLAYNSLESLIEFSTSPESKDYFKEHSIPTDFLKQLQQFVISEIDLRESRQYDPREGSETGADKNKLFVARHCHKFLATIQTLIPLPRLHAAREIEDLRHQIVYDLNLLIISYSDLLASNPGFSNDDYLVDHVEGNTSKIVEIQKVQPSLPALRQKLEDIPAGISPDFTPGRFDSLVNGLDLHLRLYLPYEKVMPRPEAMAAMQRAFEKSHAIVGIFGRRDIGKSSFVMEFIRRKAKNYDYVFFLQADKRMLWNSCFDLIDDNPQIFGKIESHDDYAPNIISVIQKWFRTNKNWLLVLDYVEHENLAYLSQYFPFLSNNESSALNGSTVILTHQYQRPSGIRYVDSWINMAELDVEEICDVLCKKSFGDLEKDTLLKSSNYQHLRDITVKLKGSLPAIDLAASLIRRDLVSAADYASMLAVQSRNTENLKKNINDQRATIIVQETACAFDIQYDMLARLAYVDSKGAPLEILRLCAFLQENILRKDLLKDIYCHPNHDVRERENEEIEEAFMILEKLALIKLIRESPPVYQIQKSLQGQLRKRFIGSDHEKTIAHMSAYFFAKIDLRVPWYNQQHYLPHIEVLYGQIKQKDLTNTSCFAMISKAAILACKIGRLDIAFKFIDQIKAQPDPLRMLGKAGPCLLNSVAINSMTLHHTEAEKLYKHLHSRWTAERSSKMLLDLKIAYCSLCLMKNDVLVAQIVAEEALGVIDNRYSVELPKVYQILAEARARMGDQNSKVRYLRSI